MEGGKMSETMTLGAIIDALKARPPEQAIHFNFARLVPTILRSWRGDHSQLAIGYGIDAWPHASVARLLEQCIDAIDKTFEGYKGGSYRMTRETRVYVDNKGDSTGWAVTGVGGDEYGTVLIAEHVDDY